MVKDRILDVARNLKETDMHEVGIVPDLTIQQRREEQQMVEEVERKNTEELSEEDAAKNLKWLVVGPRGAKRIIKGVPREQIQPWRGTGRGGRGLARGGARTRGGGTVATGANSTAVGPAVLPRSRIESNKRIRETDSVETMEETEEDEEGGRSPLRKK